MGTGDWGNIDYELMTANFKWKSEQELQRIKELRPNAPVLVSEFWPGWFDHWFEPNHNILSEEDFRDILGNIFNANASVNFFMFHGGTNFAFMNGANILGYNGAEVAPNYVPDVTSYDYDAPITESGHYTAKYNATLEMIAAYDPLFENLGRANFGSPHNFDQKKGLWEGDVLLDEQPLDDWEHIAVEMKPEWLTTLDNWQPYTIEDNLHFGPRLLKGSLTIDVPEDGLLPDTFFDFDCGDCVDWKHGAVFVNGFNIGRYHQAGPQKSLYIPGPLLHQGENEVIVFENYLGS